MIKSIELKNIQSHENTRIELDKGINCIVGSSNNGKSAILRGLYWARYNRPLGVDTLCSHWALTDKGDLKSEMSVTIENENGIVCRKRTKTENQYIVNDEILNVVKSDVPADVEQILKLSDTNIQKQLDEPFLLSKSSGEVAKYFNKVVRLDVIDRVLTNAETTRRKTQGDIKNVQTQIADCESKLQAFEWLDDVEKLIEKYERVSNRKNKIEDDVMFLEKSLSDYESCTERILEKQKKLVAEVEEWMQRSTELGEQVAQLAESIEEFESIKEYPDFTEEKKLITRIENWNEDNLKKDISVLKEEIYDYGIQEMHIKNSVADIKCLKEQLPDICPLCGNPMKNGVCVNE
jgi:DNA repair exonuclease SbcCD ATPase subunit